MGLGLEDNATCFHQQDLPAGYLLILENRVMEIKKMDGSSAQRTCSSCQPCKVTGDLRFAVRSDKILDTHSEH